MSKSENEFAHPVMNTAGDVAAELQKMRIARVPKPRVAVDEKTKAKLRAAEVNIPVHKPAFAGLPSTEVVFIDTEPVLKRTERSVPPPATQVHKMRSDAMLKEAREAFDAQVDKLFAEWDEEDVAETEARLRDNVRELLQRPLPPAADLLDNSVIYPDYDHVRPEDYMGRTAMEKFIEESEERKILTHPLETLWQIL